MSYSLGSVVGTEREDIVWGARFCVEYREEAEADEEEETEEEAAAPR